MGLLQGGFAHQLRLFTPQIQLHLPPLWIVTQLRDEGLTRFRFSLGIRGLDLDLPLDDSRLFVQGLFVIRELGLQVVDLRESFLHVFLQLFVEGLVFAVFLLQLNQFLGQLFDLQIVFLRNQTYSGRGWIPAHSTPSLSATVPGGLFCLLKWCSFYLTSFSRPMYFWLIVFCCLLIFSSWEEDTRAMQELNS